jgi:hypothetical protein
MTQATEQFPEAAQRLAKDSGIFATDTAGYFECTHRLTCERISKTWTRVLKQLQVEPLCVFPSKMQISVISANSYKFTEKKYLRVVLKYPHALLPLP